MIDEESVFDHVPARDVIEPPYDPDRPDQSSPEWADYAMGQFLDSELIEINGNKYPNCYGLRRVARALIGRIVDSGIKSFSHVNGNQNKTIVHYQITFETGETVSDIASVSPMNTDDLFLGYAEETASTRAEGRCLRKALMLNCVAAEELTRNKDVAKEVRQVMNTGPTDGSYDSGGKITDNQLRLLLNKCNQLNIDELKFVNVKQEFLASPSAPPVVLCGTKNFSAVNEVSKKEAIDMIKLLNNYQNNSQSIPKEILKG